MMDKKLFKSFFKKEEWAVKTVYNQYSRLVKHISFQILNDNDLCNDVVNETFIHLLNKGQIDDRHNFVAYMCQIARNLSIDIVNERNKFETLDNDVPANDEKPEEVLTVLKENLEKDEYDILILRAVLGYPFKDIADMYKTSSSSIRGIYHRCRIKAKKLLEGLL